MKRARWIPIALLAWPLAGRALAQEEDPTSWIVNATTVHTAVGEAIEDGHVTVEGGRIVEVGPGRLSGPSVLEAAAVTPGLVDLSVRVAVDEHAVEQSEEVSPTRRVEQAVDLFSPRWGRELASGVTTALVTPPDEDVIGGLCVVVKTGGEPTLDARVVKRDAVLRGSMGSQPSARNYPPRGTPPRSFYARRPTTRMGVEWEWRDAFYGVLAARRIPELRFDGFEVLDRVLAGEIPLSIQAWTTQDVRTAIYLKEEFGIPRVWVDAAAEAWREPELLERSGIGVVLPPHRFDGRTDQEDAFFGWHSARLCHERGVPFAFSGHGSEDDASRLYLQPAWAMRGGLPFEAALQGATITPARMAGVDDRVGSLEAGKDADLVLWSGVPFQPTSRIVGVMLEGRLVVDPRPER